MATPIQLLDFLDEVGKKKDSREETNRLSCVYGISALYLFIIIIFLVEVNPLVSNW